MESVITCNVCFVKYDSKANTPRFLPCGHTICSTCLPTILSNPKLRKCPFDNLAFAPHQNFVASFPINFLVMDMLEQKNNNLCKTHLGEKLKYICLTDKTKICSECAKHEEHNGHRIKKIKELKAQGAKVKGELQKSLLNIRDYELEKDQECKQRKKVFIKTIDDQFKAVKEILTGKQFELAQQANSLFDTETQNAFGGTLLLKLQIDETIKDITHACQDEKSDLMILDKETNDYQSFGEKQSQFLKAKSSRVQNKLLEMQKDLKAALENFNRVINSFSLVNQEVVKEIYSVPEEQQQPSQKELTNKQKKLKSIKLQTCFEFNKKSECLEISVPRPKPMEVEINQDDFKDIKTITMTIQSLTTITQEMKDHNKSLLQYILNGLESFHTLNVSFLKEGGYEDAFLWLGNVFHNHFCQLKKFYFRVPEGPIDDKSFQILCDDILSKTINLNCLWLDLRSGGIRDQDIKPLIQSIQPVQKKLEDFSIALKGYSLTDYGIIELFQTIQNMDALQDLQVILSGGFIFDKCLEMFGETVLPNLKALNSLDIRIYSTKFSEKGVWSILKNLPDLKDFELHVDQTKISAQIMKAFFDEILPKLKSLEYFTFISQDQQIKNAKVQDFMAVKKVQKVQKVQTVIVS